MQHYKKIEIFTNEEARWQGQPLYAAVVQFIHDLKIAARCLVTRGIEGCYESGEMATGRLEVLSYNLPVCVTIVAPAAESERILAQVEGMVADGLVTVQEVQIISYKSRGRLLPRHTRVRDIMTPTPRKVNPDTPLDEVARLLLSSTFTGVPVVDDRGRPVGVISQSDLLYKAGMPMRLGLLAASDQGKVAPVLAALKAKKAKDVMTSPPVIIGQDDLVTAAVDLMLNKQVKRLPVVDGEGKLVGVLSRLDVFHTVLRECPDWQAFQQQKIAVDNLHAVADIMRRDTQTVRPDTPVAEVLRLIDSNDLQRVCVVDQDGHLLGLISDRDLLSAFSRHAPGIWDFFVSKLAPSERGRLGQDWEGKTAGEVMKTDIVTVQEDAPIDEAIRLMLQKAFKRLPVIDAQGKFKGMISRDGLLRAGFASASQPSASRS